MELNDSIHYEYDEAEETSSMQKLSTTIKMGKESSHWRNIQELQNEPNSKQRDADIIALSKKEVAIDKQLFGIGNQYKPRGVSLDEKYPGEGIQLDKKFDGDSPYRIETDHMMPLIPPFTDLKLRYSTDFASGEVCVYRYRGENYCNEIIRENGKLIARSLNPKYKPVTLDPDEFHFLAVIDSVHYFLKDLLGEFLKGYLNGR